MRGAPAGAFWGRERARSLWRAPLGKSLAPQAVVLLLQCVLAAAIPPPSRCGLVCSAPTLESDPLLLLTLARAPSPDGRPHPGKNWDRTFTNPKCPIAPKLGGGLQKMQAMQDKYDPQRVFEPELWARAIAGDKYFLSPKCQLNRSCYCEADENCADGFMCVPSIAFPQYKACRPKVMN